MASHAVVDVRFFHFFKSENALQNGVLKVYYKMQKIAVFVASWRLKEDEKNVFAFIVFSHAEKNACGFQCVPHSAGSLSICFIKKMRVGFASV